LIIKNNTTKLLVTLSFLLILPFIQKQWLNLYSFNINVISFYSIIYYLSGAICPSLVYINSLKNYTYYNFTKDKIHSIKLIKGKVGKELDVTAGYNAAKRCALSIIAQVKKACDNDLSKIKSCVKLTGFVNSTNDFIDQPKVINGASDLIASIFGDAGMHTRAAVSTNSLPLGVSVEVDAIFELN